MYIHSTWVAASLLITVVMALAIVGKTFLAVRNARVMSFLAKAHTSSVSTVSELSLSCTHQHTHVVYVYVYDAFRVVLVLHTRTHVCVYVYSYMYVCAHVHTSCFKRNPVMARYTVMA